MRAKRKRDSFSCSKMPPECVVLVTIKKLLFKSAVFSARCKSACSLESPGILRALKSAWYRVLFLKIAGCFAYSIRTKNFTKIRQHRFARGHRNKHEIARAFKAKYSWNFGSKHLKPVEVRAGGRNRGDFTSKNQESSKDLLYVPDFEDVRVHKICYCIVQSKFSIRWGRTLFLLSHCNPFRLN